MEQGALAYNVLDIIPIKGLLRTPVDDLLQPDAFSNVINMRFSERPGLWITRDGQRAFRLYIANGGIEPDTNGWFLNHDRDYGNYVVCEIPFGYVANNTVRRVRYNTWALWEPRHQDGTGAWVDARTYWGAEYNQELFVETRNSSNLSTYNPTDQYTSCFVLIQRSQNILKRPAHFMPEWLDDYLYADKLLWGKLYYLMLPSIPDTGYFRRLHVTAGKLQIVPNSAFGWLGKWVLSADWSWQSPFAVYHLSARGDVQDNPFPWGGILHENTGPFGGTYWDDGDFTNPLYWSGRSITLGNYTVICHPGMLQEYFVDTIEDNDGIVYTVSENGITVPNDVEYSKPWRKDYLIGDVVLYDGESVGAIEQRKEEKLPVVIQENSVGRVGPDILALDLRLGNGEENDMVDGVKTGLGLYRFYADVSYTLAEDLTYDRSVFELLKERQLGNVVEGWFDPDSIWSIDTGSGYFAKTHEQFKTSALTDNAGVSEELFQEDYGRYTGVFVRPGITYTGFNLEAWNDLQHKAFGAFLAMMRWSEEIFPTLTWRTTIEKIQVHPYMLFCRLDRRDGNNWLFTKTIWGEGRRPFICGWTRLGEYGNLTEKEKDEQDLEARVHEKSAPAWSNAFVVDNDHRHIFSGVQDTVPVPDLLKEPILYNPFATASTTTGDEEEGFRVMSKKDIAADVFVWGEVQLPYYPCSGRIRGMFLETFYDRLWDKLSSQSVRTYDVPKPEESSPKQLAPIAGWSYRFVYEYHDGTFSAPSPIYEAPTLLFSPFKDEEVEVLGNGYKRPIFYSGDGTEAVWHESLQPYNTPPVKLFLQFPSLQQFEVTDAQGTYNVYYPAFDSGPLHKLDYWWGVIRQKLYAEEHLYYDIVLPNPVDSSNYYRYLDAITAKFALIQVWDDSGQHALASITPIGEGLCLADTSFNPDKWYDKTFVYRLIKVYARLPFLPGDNKASWNSLFSPPGKYGGYYRMTYRRYAGGSNGVRTWDYLSKTGEYLFYPNQCLLTGLPAGTVEAYISGNPSSLTSYLHSSDSNYNTNMPFYMPFVPLQGNANNASQMNLVLPSWALRRKITTTSWAVDSGVVMPSTTFPPPVEWLRWGIDAHPCSEVGNSYVQLCWDGESQTTAPLRWARWRYSRATVIAGITSYSTDAIWIPQALIWDRYDPAGSDYCGQIQYELPHGYDAQPNDHRNREGWWEPAYHYNAGQEAPGDEAGSPAPYYATETRGVSLKNLTTACGLWNVLRESSSTGAVDKYIYVNIICPLWDRCNEDGYEEKQVARSEVIDPSFDIKYPLRVPSILRYIKDASSIVSYSSFRAGVPADVSSRIVLSGKVPLRIAISRFSNPSQATLVSFAGTRKTYFGHYVTDNVHATQAIDFTDAEREGRVANVPHVKSRWTPVVTGHALSNVRSKRQLHKTHGEKKAYQWLFEVASRDKDYVYRNHVDGDDSHKYNQSVNLYSHTIDLEPHWMLPDGVLCAQWQINLDMSAVPTTGESGRGLHLRENPRRIPPLRYNLLRDVNPFIFWAKIEDNVPDNQKFPQVSWTPPAGLASYVPAQWNAVAWDIPRPYYDYPAWGVSSDGPLATDKYPPIPWSTKCNWFWKYVPLQAYCLKFWTQHSIHNNRHHWWYRPYWVYEYKYPKFNIGLPSSTSGLLTNHPDDDSLVGEVVVVRFPTDDEGRYIYPNDTKKATIVAATNKDSLSYTFAKLLPGAFTLSYGMSDLWYDPRVAGATSFDCAVYLQGHRVLFVEQLTMYYTAKMLFDAPRLGLWFKRNAIPPRVKRIHIYRTRHIDDNAWHPDEFGYVGSVDAHWEYDEEGRRTNDLYFFDNVPDSKLDFGDDITRFEALDRGLSSVAATVLSERVYYGNIRESYLPLRPAAISEVRSSLSDKSIGWGVCAYSALDYEGTMGSGQLTGIKRQKAFYPGSTLMYRVPLPKGILLSSYNPDEVFGEGKDVAWFATTGDIEGYLSDPYVPYYSEARTVMHDTVPTGVHVNNKAVCNVLYGISHPVDNAEYTLVWSTEEWNRVEDASTQPPKWRAHTHVGKASGGIAVDWGAPTQLVERNYRYEWPWQKPMVTWYTGDVRYTPYAPAIIYRYNSAIRWSDLRQPQVIRGSSIEFVRDGDGDEIVALATTYNGNLLVFKRRSIVRLMLAGGFEIARRDQVSDQHGIIGPHAFASVGNYIILVSHDGIYAYDDNSIKRIDEAIHDEILARLKVSHNGLRDPLLQMTRVWYNKSTNEVYINIPVYGDQYSPYYHLDGGVSSDRESIPLVGDVYVWHVGTQVWTKYQYPSIIECNRLYRQYQSVPSDVSGWLHHIRNYYTDTYGRLWSIPIYPSSIKDGGQVYLEGPHGNDSIWARSTDDVFGEISFTVNNRVITVDTELDKTHSPPDNIYRRQVRSVMTSPALKGVMTFKFKPRSISVVGYWYRGMGNTIINNQWDGYVDAYDAGVGYGPALLSVMGMRVYNQLATSYGNQQYVQHHYFWGTDNGTYSYSLKPQTYRAQAIVLDSVFYEGGEFTFVPLRKNPVASLMTRGEEIILSAESWGKFAFRGWHIVLRQQENYLR
jgi:hypothetical protein